MSSILCVAVCRQGQNPEMVLRYFLLLVVSAVALYFQLWSLNLVHWWSMLTYFLKNVQSMYFMQQKIITETQLHKKLWSTTKKNNTTNKKRKQNQQEPKARARPKRSEPAIESTARTHAHQLESNNPHPTKEVRGCLQNNASKGEVTPTDTTIICLPAKEKTKFSPGEAKWVPSTRWVTKRIATVVVDTDKSRKSFR